MDWDLSLDKDGERTYMIKWLVESTSVNDDPSIIYNASGLPSVGSGWGYGNGVDLWAWCRPDWKITPLLRGEPNTLWTVEQNFASKMTSKRCQNTTIENPLNEPDRIGGSFTKFQRTTLRDKDGNPIMSSSYEPIKGIQTDDNRPNVTIEKNVSFLGIGTWSPMIDTVNSTPMWGLPARTVKLSNVSWRRLLYGVCTYYYVVSYEFEVDYTTFDHPYWDRGNRTLKEGGDPTNPKDFKPIEEETTGELMYDVLLDGNGQVWEGESGGPPGIITPEIYDESNFLLLGIPATLA
jgi:hypothetical protein